MITQTPAPATALFAPLTGEQALLLMDTLERAEEALLATLPATAEESDHYDELYDLIRDLGAVLDERDA